MNIETQIKKMKKAAQGLTEYMIILGLIALVAITLVTGVGQKVAGVFSQANTDLLQVKGATNTIPNTNKNGK